LVEELDPVFEVFRREVETFLGTMDTGEHEEEDKGGSGERNA
jgi:hypothetical protein